MTLSDAIQSLYNDIERTMSSTVAKVEELRSYTIQEFERIKPDIYTEFGAEQMSMVHSIFDDVIQEFYASYSPTSYGRRESLYNTFEPETNMYGMMVSSAAGYDDIYNKSYPESRSGGSLFELVMVAGFHGGAAGTDSHGKSAAGPHYREPIPFYSHWDGPAVRTKSPYNEIRSKLGIAEGGEIFSVFKRICDEHTKEVIDNVNARIDSIL